MPKSEIGSKRYKCKFPAKRWLAVEQEISRLVDGTKDEGVIRLCGRIMLSIEDIAILHEHATGCLCWKKAGKGK